MSTPPKDTDAGDDKEAAAPPPKPAAGGIPEGRTERLTHGQEPQTTGRVGEVETFDRKDQP